jgi:triphosphoribosyl-dephospho-CoA synthase
MGVGRRVDFIKLIALKSLSLGLRLEPLLHPKPGAVTRIKSHADKNVIDFCVHAFLVEASMLRAFIASEHREEDPLSTGLEEYLNLLKKFNIKKNIALGSALLHIPLASALGLFESPPEVERLVSVASATALSSRRGGEVYYRILEYLRPSHLRKYEGPIPGVGSGYPGNLAEVLRVTRWDYVHSELLNGYKLSLEALKMIMERAKDASSIEEPALYTLINMLSRYGDTLIMTKYGIRAMERAKKEASIAKYLSEKLGIVEALEDLDRLWRNRGWNPGAILDILSTAISLYYYDLVRKKVSLGGYDS